MKACPRFILVTVANTTPQSLYDLLHAIDSDTPKVCQYCQLFASIGNLDKLVFLGNSDLNTTTLYGAALQAGQPYTISSMDANLIHLDQIFLGTDGTNVTVGVAFITR